jgi:hypothetical protein
MTPTTSLRVGLVLTLSLLAVLFSLGVVRGQIGPIQTVWKCSRCGAALARGGPMPRLANCPQCSAQLADGIGGFNAGPQMRPAGPFNNRLFSNNTTPSASGSSSLPLVIGLAFFGVVLVGGGLLVTLALCARKPDPLMEGDD